PEHYFLADVTRLPRLEVVDCHARNHFARSILVKTRNVLLEGNTIVDPLGCGIVIAAEPWWCEGVCAEDVIIRRNRIVSTREAWGDTGGIHVMADCPIPTGFPLRNITIEDNLVDCPKCQYGISVRNVEGLTLRRNRVIARTEGIHLESCTRVNADL
ncbi:MAG: hypothetical protein IKZ21_00960, partial [Clostridia bacterium]|nr:hypothetical protein [Clostridia bacterium]